MCFPGGLLLQHTCFFSPPCFLLHFSSNILLANISPSQFFFQIVTMTLKENFFSLVGDINGNLVSEWLAEIDKVLFIGTS